MALLRALALFACLAAILALMSLATSTPAPVVLTWKTTTFTTTVPVAITLVFIAALLVFYLGRIASWMVNLPASIRGLLSGRKTSTRNDLLLQAFAALYLNDTPAASKISAKLSTSAPEDPFTKLIKLATENLTEEEAAELLEHPTLGLPVSLAFARAYAHQQGWSKVKSYSSYGLRQSANHPALTVLHFKALVNLNDPATINFLPQLKSMLPASTYKLLGTIVAAGITTPHAAALSHPWVKKFHQWLPTASEVLPDDPKTPSR